MASQPPAGPTRAQVRAFNLRQNALSKQALEDRVPVFVNYDYASWRDIWRSIRHAMIGEVSIKQHAHHYLPRPSGMNEDEFAAYKDRAVFYNMVYRTVTGLTGTVFLKDPRLTKAGPKLTALTKRIAKDGLSLNMLAKVATQDVLAVGRFGILADKAIDDVLAKPTDPYLAAYTAENILDWDYNEIDGRNELTYVLLREFKTDRRLAVLSTGKNPSPIPNQDYGRFYCIYRALRLVYNPEFDRYEYQQEVYENPNADANMTEDPVITQPLVFGVPMKSIPFRFFNATTSRCDVEKPPILDILTLNMAHFKQYAQLNHARFYTANPVYVVSGASDEDEYHIGPSVVWQINKGEKAEILEYEGKGLDSLEKGLDVLETQASSIGGRLVGDSPNAGQSDNQIKLKDRNEQSLLLNVTSVINENFTDLLMICAQWINEDASNIAYQCNMDYLMSAPDARSFRAVQQMYQAGVLPIDVVYEYFLKAEVIPDFVTLDQFKQLLNNVKDQFPNQAGVSAMADGYANATDRMLDRQFDEGQEFTAEQAEANRAHDESLQDTELAHEATQNTADRKSAETVAKNTPPPIPPVPAQAHQANTVDPKKTPNPSPAPAPSPGVTQGSKPAAGPKPKGKGK